MKFWGPGYSVQCVPDGESLIFTARILPRGIDVLYLVLCVTVAVLTLSGKLWVLGAISLGGAFHAGARLLNKRTSTLRVDASGYYAGSEFHAWNSIRDLQYRPGQRGLPDNLAGMENTWPSIPLPMLLYVNQAQCNDVIRKIDERFPHIVFGSSDDGPAKMLREVVDMFHK
jgi:hypothetical protein